MNTTRSKWLLFISLVALLFLGTASAKEATKSTLSKKELKALIAQAKTSEDHQKLAAYYRQQAQYLAAQQKEHEDMAKEYDKDPRGYPTKPVSPSLHCRNWAGYYGQAAKETQALAALHAEMAKAAAQ